MIRRSINRQLGGQQNVNVIVILMILSLTNGALIPIARQSSGWEKPQINYYNRILIQNENFSQIWMVPITVEPTQVLNDTNIQYENHSNRFYTIFTTFVIIIPLAAFFIFSRLLR